MLVTTSILNFPAHCCLTADAVWLRVSIVLAVTCFTHIWNPHLYIIRTHIKAAQTTSVCRNVWASSPDLTLWMRYNVMDLSERLHAGKHAITHLQRCTVSLLLAAWLCCCTHSQSRKPNNENNVLSVGGQDMHADYLQSNVFVLEAHFVFCLVKRCKAACSAPNRHLLCDLYSLDFYMRLFVIAPSTSRHLWVGLYWAVQL